MVEDNYMSGGRSHTQVADMLDRVVALTMTRDQRALEPTANGFPECGLCCIASVPEKPC
jgi:hypothetical protein